MRNLLAYILICIGLCLTSCEKDTTPVTSLPPEGTLANYILQNNNLELSDELIACAAGGQSTIWDDADFPVSVLFYPVEGATNFRYFETDDLNVDADDYTAYKEKSLSEAPIFNGYLRRFLREPLTNEALGIVVYNTPGKLHLSNVIRIKFSEKPTQFAPELCQVDLSNPTEPRFQWQEGLIPENVIYFHVISDESGSLISGTYTFDQFFRFYDLSNVVLNIRDITPPPTLQPNTKYTFTMLGVSRDNWVNLIIEKEFTTE